MVLAPVDVVLLIVILFAVVLAAMVILLPGIILKTSEEDAANINEELALTVAKEYTGVPLLPEIAEIVPLAAR